MREGYGSQYILEDCFLDDLIREAVCTKSLIQEFALMCFDYGIRWGRPEILLSLLSAVGTCYVSHKNDAFMARLRVALDKRNARDAIEQIGMFVALNGQRPEYAVRVIKQDRPWAPSTPHQLLG